MRELLDRGYGKPAQPIANDDDNPFELIVRHLDGLTRGVLPSQYKRPPPLRLDAEDDKAIKH